MAGSSKEISEIDKTMDSIRPSDGPDGSPESQTFAGQRPKVYLRLAPFPNNVQLTKEQEEAYKITNSTTLLTKLPCSFDDTTISTEKSSQVKTVWKEFTFTETFSSETTQSALFDRVIKPQMTEFLAGKDCVTMTYGTINSGKSYTMQGSTSCPGIIPRSLEYIFSNIDPDSSPCYKPYNNCDIMSLTADERAAEVKMKTKILMPIVNNKAEYEDSYKQMQQLHEEESLEKKRFSQASDGRHLVWISFAEIYNEKIFDLLLDNYQKHDCPLELETDTQGQVFVKNLRQVFVDSAPEAYQVFKAGQCNLTFANTALNSHSSRSHCIFMITLLKYHQGDKPEQVEISRFSFCDLGGFELQKKTLNVGDRLKEMQDIKLSLLVIGKCLSSIFNGQMANECNERFQNSKLTRLFQQALSGEEIMTLIVNVNLLLNLYENTLFVLNRTAIVKEIIAQQRKPKLLRSEMRSLLIPEQSAEISTELKEEDKEDYLYVRQLDKIGEYHKGSLVSRKRRHLHDDDDDDDGESLSARLRSENTRLTAENQTLKKTIENLREKKMKLKNEKKTLSCESDLNKEELPYFENVSSMFVNSLADEADDCSSYQSK